MVVVCYVQAFIWAGGNPPLAWLLCAVETLLEWHRGLCGLGPAEAALGLFQNRDKL